MSTKITSIDKVYKLLTGSPLSYTLASRNHAKFPLMWFDEKNNVNRALRYAKNQKSPFEDEQDGNPIIEPIIFEDGMLRVPRQNPVLQEFLHYHPLNGITFAEIDKEKDAKGEMEDINVQVDALVEARQLGIDQIEMLTRVMFGKDPTTTSTSELRRDLLVYAKNEPQEFLRILNDPELRFQSKIHLFFEKNLIQLRNNGKEVWFNTTTNKKKMLSVPFGEDPNVVVAQHLKSDEGIDALEMLDKLLL